MRRGVFLASALAAALLGLGSVPASVHAAGSLDPAPCTADHFYKYGCTSDATCANQSPSLGTCSLAGYCTQTAYGGCCGGICTAKAPPPNTPSDAPQGHATSTGALGSSDAPDGTDGGKCHSAMPFCDANLFCVGGTIGQAARCQKTRPMAGQIGARCLADGTCMQGLCVNGVQCIGNLDQNLHSTCIIANGGLGIQNRDCAVNATVATFECVASSSTLGTATGRCQLATGYLGGACTSTGTCNAGLMCNPNAKRCVRVPPPDPTGNGGDDGNSTGGNSGSSDDSSDSNSGTGGHGRPDTPHTCPSVPCATGQVCLAGKCFTPRDKPCAMACNPSNGETCDRTTGLCVVSSAPTCGASCSTGHGICLASPVMGRGPICVTDGDGSSAPATCSSNSDCSASSVCTRGHCASCGILCTAVASLDQASRDELTNLVSQVALPTSYTTVTASTAVANQVDADGTLEASSGDVMQLDSNSAAKVHTLSFPSTLATTTANGDASAAGAQVQAGASVTLPTVDAESVTSQILVGAGATLQSTKLAVKGALALSLAAGTSLKPTIASFLEVHLEGPMSIVSNGPFGVVAFPPSHGRFNYSATAQVQVSGGASLRGDAGGCPIVIQGTDSNTASASANSYASIESGQIFTSSGQLIGSAATLAISGIFNFSGSVLEPTMKISKNAIARVQLSADSSVQLQAGPVNLAVGATLQLNASDAAAGARALFGKLTNCPTGSTLIYKLTGVNVRDAALQAGFTFFNMASATVTERAAFTCNIQVCDDAGCTAVQNPNNAAPSSRRLLNTAQNTATWNENSMQVKQTTIEGSAAISAASNLQSGLFASVFLTTILALAQLLL